MVGFVCAVYQIASVPEGAKDAQRGHAKGGGKRKLGDNAKRERELAWTR
jgi:hypothetical protein